LIDIIVKFFQSLVPVKADISLSIALFSLKQISHQVCAPLKNWNREETQEMRSGWQGRLPARGSPSAQMPPPAPPRKPCKKRLSVIYNNHEEGDQKTHK
jgi:hypothetical protein